MIALVSRTGKQDLILESPVMPAAGTVGFTYRYADFVDAGKLGAMITNPVTFDAWSPASGTRVVPLNAGVLIHTGLPNDGLYKTIQSYRAAWRDMKIPLILHLVATDEEQVRRGVAMIDAEDSIAGVELGLRDDLTAQEAKALVEAATNNIEKPVLVRLPLSDAYDIAHNIYDLGIAALVLTAPPRGTARDPRSGRLISGRVYGPMVKPVVLHLVGTLARQIKDVPIIGAGGIHSMQDARDYLDAGAVAVQLDSVIWMQPRLLKRIARDLRGTLMTRPQGAFPDEWNPDKSETGPTWRVDGENQDTARRRR